jgi:hypothetical protein
MKDEFQRNVLSSFIVVDWQFNMKLYQSIYKTICIKIQKVQKLIKLKLDQKVTTQITGHQG